ncbi:TetR family transcriptional regulator [Haloechinothrix sp. LS1_15]|uniref:TetR/AcrR family transcriptional regulator n=1 Tax=Haloechinothrix sp. LS1_15 TaxID=2652248 RepID=UPI002945ABB1|nr:TetR family transcriptional regulator [Haloechinothrix sp. LS1_15]MDV6014603.1 TetR/AcrR family transcriptional regulator [Haloechinothrix sp. LS1_15]
MPSTRSTEQRTWAGTTLADRRAARRRQLLDAGLELLGNEGAAAVSVRAVCRTARLTERYFYENFAGREELLVAVYEHVARQAHDVLVRAVREAGPTETDRARAAVSAFVELILDDPRKGTVLMLVPQTDPLLGKRGHELLPTFAELVHEQLPGGIDPANRTMVALGLVGALANLFIAYLNGSLAVSRDQLVDHCVHLVLSSASLYPSDGIC